MSEADTLRDALMFIRELGFRDDEAGRLARDWFLNRPDDDEDDDS